MRFRFRLDSLLKHREQLKDEAQRDWMQAQNKVNDCLEKIQSMYDQMDQTRQMISSTGSSGEKNQTAVFASANEFLDGQKIKVERKRMEARELMAIAEEKREHLILVTQDFEALKKLKKRKRDEFLKTKKKKEARELDDLVTMRFTRSGS